MKLQDVDLRKVYRMWKYGLGPFQAFFRSSPFVSLQTYEDFELEEDRLITRNENALNRIIENLNEGNFIIVDLPLSEILDIALILNNEYLIKPILNINLLFHPFGIVGDKSSINKLINYGIRLEKIKAKNFIMLIPYDRYIDDVENKDFKDKLNNQYEVGEEDLPYSYMLKELKYNKVILLTKEYIKEDIQYYVKSIDKDLEVEIIKVMSL